MAEENIALVTPQKGKKWDENHECIADHTVGKKMHIVFLPREAQPDQQVRVRLQEIRPDGRGNMMYRGLPAPVEYIERWRDNGDGTASRVTISRDWLMEEREEGVIEPRPLEKREGEPLTPEITYSVVWGGNSLEDSVIVETSSRCYPQQIEVVKDNTIVWTTESYRKEEMGKKTFHLTRLSLIASTLRSSRLAVLYTPDMAVSVRVGYEKDSVQREHTHDTTWAEMPAWWQAEHEAQYPLCLCGRYRIETQADGYPKCEKCRAEETCVRCSKKPVKVKNFSGRLICTVCEPYEEREAMIERSFPVSKREEIANIAKKLLAGEALPRETGEVILAATLDHITDESRRNSILRIQKEYPWYYFCEDGVYGSRFPRETLELLTYLPLSSGNALVEMVAWTIECDKGSMRVEDSFFAQNFYQQTQIAGKTETPTFSEAGLNKAIVAEKIRGNERDRKDSVRRYAKLAQALGEHDKRIETIRERLNADAQNYSRALQEIATIEQFLYSIQTGEIWPAVRISRHTGRHSSLTVWAITDDGSLLEESSNSDKNTAAFGDIPTSTLIVGWGYGSQESRCSESWRIERRPGEKENRWETKPGDYRPVTAKQVETLNRLRGEHTKYFSAGEELGWDTRTWKQVTVTTEASQYLVGQEATDHEEMLARMPLDISEWFVESSESEWERVYTVHHRPCGSSRPKGDDELRWIEAAVKAEEGKTPSRAVAEIARDLAEVARLTKGAKGGHGTIRLEKRHGRYPWQKRRENLLNMLHGIEEYEVIDRIMELRIGSDLDAVIVGAMAWLDSRRLSVVSPTRKTADPATEATVANEPAEGVTDKPSEKAGVVFTYLGKIGGHLRFRCGCAFTDALTKTEAQNLGDKGSVEITCPGCGKNGIVKKGDA
ncbi:MAG: hypothetical protein UV70_C0009G0013 [Parcubacteria group bacterium GW2011_GWA2_43_13]|nr:MAG: hypothetical protein UV70_C0009G0013 [Parcubacteria group bacterium GW2011_GWA2_43_13]